MIRTDPMGSAGECPIPLLGVRLCLIRTGSNKEACANKPLDFLELPNGIVALEPRGYRVMGVRRTDEKNTVFQGCISLQIARADGIRVIEGEHEFSPGTLDRGPAVIHDCLPQTLMSVADIIGQNEFFPRNPFPDSGVEFHESLAGERLGPCRQRRVVPVLALDQNHHQPMVRLSCRPCGQFGKG